MDAPGSNGPESSTADAPTAVARIVIEQTADGSMRMTKLPNPEKTVFLLLLSIYGLLVEMTTPPREQPRVSQPPPGFKL